MDGPHNEGASLGKNYNPGKNVGENTAGRPRIMILDRIIKKG